MFGIGVDALDRAHGHALRLVEMADAFGAQRRVDHVDRFALRNRPVRAYRLADVAVDAELVDLQGHARIVRAARAGTVPSLERRLPHAPRGGMGKAAPAGRARPGAYFASTNTYSTPAGSTTALTRSLLAASPMYTTRTPCMVSGVTVWNALTTRSAVLLGSRPA